MKKTTAKTTPRNVEFTVNVVTGFGKASDTFNTLPDDVMTVAQNYVGQMTALFNDNPLSEGIEIKAIELIFTPANFRRM